MKRCPQRGVPKDRHSLCGGAFLREQSIGAAENLPLMALMAVWRQGGDNRDGAAARDEDVRRVLLGAREREDSPLPYNIVFHFYGAVNIVPFGRCGLFLGD